MTDLPTPSLPDEGGQGGALEALAERLEAAEAADRELDAVIFNALGRPLPAQFMGRGISLDYDEVQRAFTMPMGDLQVRYECPAYTASIDAALQLAEGYGGSFTFFKDGTAKAFFWQPYPMAIEAKAATLALAICAAALRARSAS